MLYCTTRWPNLRANFYSFRQLAFREGSKQAEMLQADWDKAGRRLQLDEKHAANWLAKSDREPNFFSSALASTRAA